MAKLCSSFVIVPKPNSTACLWLDPIRFKQVLIRLIHRGPTSNNMLSKLTNVCFMSIICGSSGYESLNLDRKSYLTLFACQFGRYRFTRLLFEAVPEDDRHIPAKNQ